MRRPHPLNARKSAFKGQAKEGMERVMKLKTKRLRINQDTLGLRRKNNLCFSIICESSSYSLQ